MRHAHRSKRFSEDPLTVHTGRTACDRDRRTAMAALGAVLLLLAPGALAAEEGATGAAAAPEVQAEDYAVVSWRDRYLQLGQDVYDWACASCHDEGLDGAPRTGRRSDWTDRSQLWSAVLVEHAKQGYLEMPAKGSHPYLSDRAVQAASEYMLGETFPEKLKD